MDTKNEKLWNKLVRLMWDIELYNEEYIHDKTIFRKLDEVRKIMKEINGLSKIS